MKPSAVARPDASGDRTPSTAIAPALDFARTEILRYQRPELPPITDVARYYALSEEQRFYSNGGPCHRLLTQRLSAYLGNVHCMPLGNCTLGLMVALRAACGDAVADRNLIVVPSFTFTATACAIRWAGFQPLFVDVDPQSWQLSPAALCDALREYEGSVAGVMGCSTFGTAPPTEIREGWRAASARHGLPLLIDSAAGFGALDDGGRLLGSQGDTEVFSFHATKPFAIGEGGAVVSADPDIAERVKRLINFGIDPGSRVSLFDGLNAKMSELQAAAGLAMHDRFDAALACRRQTAADLKARFAHYPLTYQSGCGGSTWQVFQMLVPDAAARRRAVACAQRHRIEVRPTYDPSLHRHPAFASARRSGELTVTEALAVRSLSLPMANVLGPRQIDRLLTLMDAVFKDGGLRAHR